VSCSWCQSLCSTGRHAPLFQGVNGDDGHFRRLRSTAFGRPGGTKARNAYQIHSKPSVAPSLTRVPPPK
jgi:hypothetical protein